MKESEQIRHFSKVMYPEYEYVIAFLKSELDFEIYFIKVYKNWGTMLRKIMILNGLLYMYGLLLNTKQ